MNIPKIFEKPCIVGIVANANEGKSNMLYYFIEELSKKFNPSMYAYGFRCEHKSVKQFHSVEELEQIENSIIFVDEMFSLFDLDNRKTKKLIENTIRLVFHNNNVLVLCGLGENWKKFLSAKLNKIIYKRVTFHDLINGSNVKNVIMSYKGNERGSSVLNLHINEALVFDGHSYEQIKIPYMKQYDTKAANEPILKKRKEDKKKAKEEIK